MNKLTQLLNNASNRLELEGWLVNCVSQMLLLSLFRICYCSIGLSVSLYFLVPGKWNPNSLRSRKSQEKRDLTTIPKAGYHTYRHWHSKNTIFLSNSLLTQILLTVSMEYYCIAPKSVTAMLKCRRGEFFANRRKSQRGRHPPTRGCWSFSWGR